MTAICDDWRDELLRTPPLDPNTLFACAWSHHDTDNPPGYHPILATSFHTSEMQRRQFHHELYTSYTKKWGQRVPPSYYAPNQLFSVISSPELYTFTNQMIHLNKHGIVVLISNLKYLPRLGLTQPSANLDTLISEYGKDFKEQLMTKNKVLHEIKDDTIRWYYDLRNHPYDTGWRTIL